MCSFSTLSNGPGMKRETLQPQYSRVARYLSPFLIWFLSQPRECSGEC